MNPQQLEQQLHSGSTIAAQFMRALFMRHSIFVTLFLLFSAGAARAQETSPKDWPKIAPLKKSFTFPDMGNPSVDLAIPGADGSPLYRLECRSGDSYEGKEFDYSGDFECRLNSVPGKDAYRTLLTYQPVQPRDWESRARFLVSDLEGKCGDYPEYGRVRTFRLRGMRLRLSLGFTGHGSPFPSNPGRPAPAAMRFAVEARPDPAALSQIAEDVPYVDPALLEPAPGFRTCAKVMPKHVAGAISADFLRQPRLSSPFPSIAPAEAAHEIPPGKGLTATKLLHPDSYPPDTPADVQLFYLPIRSSTGAPAYAFECATYGPEMSRAGFRCGLFLEGQYANLLEDDADPYTRRSRSHFVVAQLEGKCGEYPEWGSVLRFHLRRLQLTIELSDMKFSPRGKDPAASERTLLRAKIRVRAEPEPSATSPVALPARILDWDNAAGPGTCAQVLVKPRAEK